jgi:5,10-methylenetetrahydrofolate reductase
LTAELECPRNASAANVARQARSYARYVDAIDCTDNSAAVVRMSPIAAAALAAPLSPATLIQLTCRDRNRIALQSDALGASGLGAAGIVCIGGDPPSTGNHPEAAGVYDLTTAELIALLHGLTHGRLGSGETVEPAPALVLGCVENPVDGARSIERLIAKAEAGAEFVQTQITFDVETFGRWMELVRQAGLHQRLAIFVGVAAIRRLNVARFLAERVPGVSVPSNCIERLERAGDVEAEGVAIAAEVVRTARAIPGVAGAHLLTFGWADGVRRVAELL